MWVGGPGRGGCASCRMSASREALIAISAAQIHGGGPMEVQFKNIRIKELASAK